MDRNCKRIDINTKRKQSFIFSKSCKQCWRAPNPFYKAGANTKKNHSSTFGAFTLFFTLTLLLFFWLPTRLFAQLELTPQSNLKKNFVILTITKTNYHPLRPWVREVDHNFIAIGVVVRDNRILALAEDVRDAALIEASTHASYTKTPVQIEYWDDAANLALLTVKDPGFFKKLQPLVLGQEMDIGSFVTGIHLDRIFHTYSERLRVQEIVVGSKSNFTELPLYSFHTKETYPYGGALLCKTKLCGFISYSESEINSQAITISTIRAFLQAAEDTPKVTAKNKSMISSFISQGFFLQEIVDPVMRQYYRIPKQHSGVMVTQVIPNTSAWEVLQPKDILVAIDDIPLDDLGLYEHPGWGKQPAPLLLTMKNKLMRGSWRKPISNSNP